MSVPAKKKSRSAVRRGRAHLAASKINLVQCTDCPEKTLPHRVCPFCGMYNGKKHQK